MSDLVQLPLFVVPEPARPGWHPAGLAAGASVYWTTPQEMDARLDASYYVITRRRERLLETLQCPMTPLTAWAEVNPAAQRLPVERDYLSYRECAYAQLQDLREACWLLGPQLSLKKVRDLPRRAAYQPTTGDVLLPRFHPSLYKAVWVLETGPPLVISNVFALLHPHSQEAGLFLLGLLHHRVIGEQLWALTSGTTVRAVATRKVSDVQIPEFTPELRTALAERVDALLNAQRNAVFPELGLPIHAYWQDGTLSQWRSRARQMALDIEKMIDDALRL